jgi:hypothetical protein
VEVFPTLNALVSDPKEMDALIRGLLVRMEKAYAAWTDFSTPFPWPAALAQVRAPQQSWRPLLLEAGARLFPPLPEAERERILAKWQAIDASWFEHSVRGKVKPESQEYIGTLHTAHPVMLALRANSFSYRCAERDVPSLLWAANVKSAEVVPFMLLFARLAGVNGKHGQGNEPFRFYVALMIMWDKQHAGALPPTDALCQSSWSGAQPAMRNLGLGCLEWEKDEPAPAPKRQREEGGDDLPAAKRAANGPQWKTFVGARGRCYLFDLGSTAEQAAIVDGIGQLSDAERALFFALMTTPGATLDSLRDNDVDRVLDTLPADTVVALGIGHPDSDVLFNNVVEAITDAFEGIHDFGVWVAEP